MFRLYKKQPGFTIVELLVVIVVIGILATITIVSYTGISQKAVVSALQSDLSNAKKQLTLYQIDHSAYPTSPLNTTGNNYCPSDDSKYCFKASNGNIFTYTPASGSNPQDFSLFATKNSTVYSISNYSSPISVYAIGGTVTTDGSYRVHTFTSSGTLTVITPVTAEVLVVGGGGAGGGRHGGGGGGGGLVYNSALTINYQTYTVTVGNGGNPTQTSPSVQSTGGNGENSVFDSIVAFGGGGGGSYTAVAPTGGGSGGGGGGMSNITHGFANQGNSGGGIGYGSNGCLLY